MANIKRRAMLGGTLALAAPAVHAQSRGKPYNGVTINASCFQTTYFEYLKTYFPQFEEKTGIKVNFNMQAFPVYNQRTDLELSTKGSAMDVCNCTFVYSGRWIGAGWFTNLDTFTKDRKYTPAEWEPEDFAGGPQSAMKNAKGETFAFSWEAGAMILGAARAYVLVRSNIAIPLHLMRIPSEEDQVKYDALKAEAFTEAREKYAKKKASYDKAKAAYDKTPKGAAKPVLPEKPVEPTEANFEFTPFGLMTGVPIGPLFRFAKGDGGASTYLHELTPGRYRIYGMVSVLPNAAATGSCFCMGSVAFEVKAGQVTDLGYLRA